MTVKTWASAAEEERELIPIALQELCNNGSRFTEAHACTWRTAGGSAKLRKHLSLSFSLDVQCISVDIMRDLEEVGVITASISAVQHKATTK